MDETIPSLLKLGRSRHEDIDLTEEDEFYSQAPTAISKPVSTATETALLATKIELRLHTWTKALQPS